MYTFKLLSGHPSDEILGRTDAWTYVRGYNTYIYAHWRFPFSLSSVTIKGAKKHSIVTKQEWNYKAL